MPLQPNGQAPYTTVAAATTAIDAYRDRGLGAPVTSEILTRAGVPESISRRTLQSLKGLELLDDDGRPTAQFEALRQARGEEEFRTRLQEWLRAVYADVLQYADPSQDTASRVAEAFRSFEPAGQRKSMAALLVGLWRYAGLPVPNAESGAARLAVRSPQPRRTNRPAAGQRAPASSRSNPRPSVPTSLDGLPPGLVGLLHEVPVAGGSWTTARRDDFLRAFQAVLDFSVPIDDQPAPDEADDEADE